MTIQKRQTCLSHCALIAWLAAAVIASAPAAEPSQADTSPWQSAESIRTAAQNHVRRTTAGSNGGNTRIQAAELDARLRLPACDAPLSAATPYGRARGNRVTVRVSCTATANWRIHVPVEIVTVAPVVAAARALARGAVLSAADLVFTETELGRLGHGYFADPSQVIGQRLKRPVPVGTVLTPTQLETPPIIRRGQTVSIAANARGIDVKMTGTALADGAIGQIIDVENRSSGKRVQGIVRSARAVEILLR